MPKKIITPEVSEITCDICGKPAFSSILVDSWYGSRYDRCNLFDNSSHTVYLCDDCLEVASNKSPELGLIELIE